VLGVPFIGREVVEGEGRRPAAGGGGFLILVGFNIESGRGVEEAPT
jgi:hypothetical protein